MKRPEEFDVIEYLRDSDRVGHVSIPLQGDRLLRLHGLTRIIHPPHAELQFRRGDLPVDDIDREKECIIHFDATSKIICLTGDIVRTTGDRAITITIGQTVLKDQQRKYFRVDARTPVGAQHLQEGKAAIVTGESINISGSGALVELVGDLAASRGVWLEIDLPSPSNRSVRCICTVVRREEEDQFTRVAFHFEKIRPDDRDALISFCLEQQRQQLRLKVRVLGTVM